MKLFASIPTILLASVSISGCLYGQCLDGPCALERKKILESIKPYGAHWIKEGMTEASRLDDIATCGSARTEYIGFSEEKLKAEKRLEDPNDIAAYLRLRSTWAKCMEAKGYRYEK